MSSKEYARKIFERNAFFQLTRLAPPTQRIRGSYKECSAEFMR